MLGKPPHHKRKQQIFRENPDNKNLPKIGYNAVYNAAMPHSKVAIKRNERLLYKKSSD